MSYRPVSVSVRVFERHQAVNTWFGGRPILIAKVGEEVCALDAVCSHVGCGLLTSVAPDGTTTCPLHGARFDVRTGALVEAARARPEAPCAQENSTTPLRTYAIRVRDGALEIDMDGTGADSH